MRNSETYTDNQTEGHIASSVILTTREAASYLGLAMTTLNKWRCHGGGPVFVKLGRAVRYRREDLNVFVEQRSVLSTSQSLEDSALITK